MTATTQKEQALELMPRDEQKQGLAPRQQSQIAGHSGDKAASTLLSVIERISEMPELDLDRVERLFDMRQKMLEQQQEQEFNASMARAQSEIQAVVVNKENKHTSSKYADLSAIHEGAKPIWTKYGFSVVTRTSPSQINGFIKATCEVRHEGGHKEVFENDWPLDAAGSKGNTNKTPIQAIGSTISYIRRYTELMVFDISTKGEDDDGNRQTQQRQRVITREQVNEIMGLIQKAKTTPEQFCHHARINAIHELQAGRYQAAINSLKNKVKKAGGAK